MRPALFLLVTCLVLVACSGTGSDAGSSDSGEVSEIVITNPWSRPAALLDEPDMNEHDHAEDEDPGDGGTNGVVYMIVENRGSMDDRLVSVDADVAEALELHSVNMSDGVMQMRQVEDGIELPAGKTVALEPGGLHIMLVGLTGSLEAGDVFDLDLEFEQAGSITVEVEVREP